MSIFGSIFGTEDNQENPNNQGSNKNKNNGQQTEEGTLQLRKEELDINKNKVQTGEVILSKEVVEEQQTVNVPVTHQEVVIERRTLNNQPTDSQITSGSSSNSGSDSDSGSNSCPDSIDSSNAETIRIPVTEEKVDIGKHTVVTEEVSAYKRNIEETQQVQETIRREEAKVDKNGNPIITNEGSSAGNGSSSGNDSSYEASSSSSDSKSDKWF
jgi:stress response protein YsnF